MQVRKTMRSCLLGLRARALNARKPIWQRMYNPNGHTTPVFIVGCGRSGTTMLTGRLGKSWQVESYNENHPAAFENYRLRDLSTIEDLVSHSHAPILLVKPRLDTHRTPVFLSHFPNARILFAFRHYEDVVNSSLKRFHNLTRVDEWVRLERYPSGSVPEETLAFVRSRWELGLPPASGAALNWLFVNRVFFDANLDREGRVKLVRYETLVKNPQETLRRVCQFLGIQLDQSITKGIFSSSIRRDPPPVIDERLRADCEQLWQRLCQQHEQE